MAAEITKPLDVNEIGADYKYGFRDKEDYIFKSGRGLTDEIVTYISKTKNEPQWMLDFRLRSLAIFRKKPMPKFGNTKLLNDIDFQNIFYYIKPSEKGRTDWNEVPEGIKNTFDRLGIPEVASAAGGQRSKRREDAAREAGGRATAIRRQATD